VPNDLNDPQIRQTYIDNHIKWFLKNHPDIIKKFINAANEKYSEKMVQLEIKDFLDVVAK
jgi:site-specific DNA-methyltransferase (adenine-specific)